MSTRFIIIHGTARNDMDAIAMCGSALYKAGVVSDQFGEKCQLREKDFPTGLPTEIPVAIPHCKDEGIKENAICFLKLDHPVEFHRMDDDELSVQTDMIFNMAVKNPNEHLEALQKLMGFIDNSEALEKCRSLSDEELIAYLKENID